MIFVGDGKAKPPKDVALCAGCGCEVPRIPSVSMQFCSPECRAAYDERVSHADDARKSVPAEHDAVNHPKHYTKHPSGVECIAITEHMSFCLGNAVKYIWRAGDKGNAVQDLRKAIWYIERELARLSK